MSWYWWVILGFVLLIIIVNIREDTINRNEETQGDNEWASKAQALLIISNLRYKHLDLWAKAASKIMMRKVNPPTQKKLNYENKNHRNNFK